MRMYREDHGGDLPWTTTIPSTVESPEPYRSLLPYLDAELPVRADDGVAERVDPYACPGDGEIVHQRGFSYAYLPASFMQVLSENPDRYDMRTVLRIFAGPVPAPVFSDAQRFHLARNRWDAHAAPDRTGLNLAFLDGSVRKGE